MHMNILYSGLLFFCLLSLQIKCIATWINHFTCDKKSKGNPFYVIVESYHQSLAHQNFIQTFSSSSNEKDQRRLFVTALLYSNAFSNNVANISEGTEGGIYITAKPFHFQMKRLWFI